MFYRNNNARQRKSPTRMKTRLTVESLEPRTLLAGLINISDSIIQTPVNEINSSPAQTMQVDTVLVDTADQSVEVPPVQAPLVVDNDSVWSADRDWLNGSTDGQPESPDTDLGTGGLTDANENKDCEGSETKIDGDAMQTPPTWMMPSYGTAPISSENRKPTLITPAVHAESSDQWRHPIIGAANEQRSSIAPAFHYFDRSYDSDAEDLPTLRTEPLMSDAVQESFIAHSILKPSNRESHDLTNHKTSRLQLTEDTDVTRVVFEDENFRFVNTNEINEDIIKNAEAAIESVDQILRDANSLCEHPMSETAAVAIPALGVMESTAGLTTAIASSRSSQDRNAWMTSHWQYALFGVLSIFVSARSSGDRKDHAMSITRSNP